MYSDLIVPQVFDVDDFEPAIWKLCDLLIRPEAHGIGPQKAEPSKPKHFVIVESSFGSVVRNCSSPYLIALFQCPYYRINPIGRPTSLTRVLRDP
ncbi:hypothetical protein KIN20_004978 [Parelaphostrongylus tenuis]|uniref:Uncharacterized protein n=1 Tax=Parelaphostrongylus tenuis TaxID=148309 RepID=A0AAD5MKN7_PARTN|nr:hypothetical protein KIN20_004978 [Parelaphostrongylus tenuis]